MKNALFLLIIIFFTLLSCRNGDDGLQKIDQKLQLYIDSAGHDMLNANIPGSYVNVSLNDVNGITDSAPVSFNLKTDSDTLRYIEYFAGAKRIRIDSTADFKTYESKIAVNLTKKINDSTLAVTNDTLVLHYYFSSEVFQISKVWYNNVLSFTKTDGTPNIVKIHK